jgi:hypothetical protein
MKKNHSSGCALPQAKSRSRISSIINALFAWLISHQPAVFFSHNKSATSNQPVVLFSQNKPAPAISHQPTEQAARQESMARSSSPIKHTTVAHLPNVPSSVDHH